ncbi:haloalkane dehalogenase [Gordonia rhizosphera]|uniref:Haloalkane dehalogenase n=1 Tax=Gordonia rhizosphera NBRC 16068 TaxID=1108045 RepID=K6WLP4_9ACTN|nr:haloalkane dehalogenase [Gordonia rhizosphera]GAB93082.1 haloalkane dehalogenase [Gordonia rhizosphera NBRC 16068]
MSRILRTPDERFADLPDFPYAPHFIELGDVRMAVVDEGARDGEPVLLLHGEPTWSYLYRKMIPPLVAAGLRVVVPDLIGFGQSDKPASIEDYSYQKHVDWVFDAVRALELDQVTLFGQDWGSLIGLRIAAEHPQRFARVVIGNGFLPTAHGSPSLAFLVWRTFARWSPVFPIGRLVDTGSLTKLTKAERAAYDAPFPDRTYKAGARAFPRLVPLRADDPAVPANRAAWDALAAWDKPFLTLFGAKDPILGRADAPLQRHIPGAAGQPHDRLRGGHFIQEDQGPELARRMIEFIGAGRR